MIDRTLGLDGKTYPSGPLSTEDRAFVVGRVHYLRHDESLSVRQIVRRLADEHGLRRSVGSVSAYLAEPCIHPDCSGEQNGSPEHSPTGNPA